MSVPTSPRLSRYGVLADLVQKDATSWDWANGDDNSNPNDYMVVIAVLRILHDTAADTAEQLADEIYEDIASRYVNDVFADRGVE